MTERQNIEWKRSWQDEYLKWICGFANAQGGSIPPELVIWNEGPIPQEIKDLNAPHSSVPRNRLIADICFKTGYIDPWSRGIEKITTACTEHGCPAPNFEITPTGIRVTLLPKFNLPSQVTPQDGTSQGTVTDPVTGSVRPKSGPSHDTSHGTSHGTSRHR